MHNSKGKCIEGHKLHRNCPRTMNPGETSLDLMDLVFIFSSRQYCFTSSLCQTFFSQCFSEIPQRTSPTDQPTQRLPPPGLQFDFLTSNTSQSGQTPVPIHRELLLYHTYLCILDSIGKTLGCFTQGWVNRFHSERKVILAGFSCSTYWWCLNRYICHQK